MATKPPEAKTRNTGITLRPDVDQALWRAMAEQGRKRSQIIDAALRMYLGMDVEEAS